MKFTLLSALILLSALQLPATEATLELEEAIARHIWKHSTHFLPLMAQQEARAQAPESDAR